MAGVGSTPTRYTFIPALVKPATTAASRNSPDARVIERKKYGLKKARKRSQYSKR